MGKGAEAWMDIAIFQGIKKDELPVMLNCIGSYEKTYKRSEIIFLESQKICSIGVILSGTVHMVKEDENGHKTFLAYMKEGDLFGESFACGSRMNSRVSFLAASPCTIMFLPFYKVIHSCQTTCVFHHRLIENMVRLISDKNTVLMNKIEIVSQKTLRDKILRYLYLQKEACQSSRLVIPFGRQELADYLCADRSALTRELSLMKKEGLIDYEKNTFYLPK